MSYRRTVLMAITMVAVIAAARWLRGLPVRLSALPFAVALLVVLGVFTGWLGGLASPEVTIRERSITRVTAGGTHLILPREEISHYEISTIDLEGKQIPVLTIRTTSGGVLDIELPDDLSPTAVLAALGPQVAA